MLHPLRIGTALKDKTTGASYHVTRTRSPRDTGSARDSVLTSGLIYTLDTPDGRRVEIDVENVGDRFELLGMPLPMDDL